LNFQVSHGLTTSEAETLLKQWGRNELVEKSTPVWLIIFRLLTGPMPIMLWIASLIELIIGNYPDMAILLGIQFINAAISFYETTKAGNAVKALKASLKPVATVKRDGQWQNVDAAILVPGDLVKLAAGSAIPADCWVNEGEIEVDQSAMTGESLPVKFRPGDVCKMGSTVTRGEVDGTVETTGSNTFFGKTAAMLQSVDSSGGSLQTLLIQVMIVLVVLSLTLCTIAFIYLIIVGDRVNATLPSIHQKSNTDIVTDSLSFAVVVLVASIPLAVEIVTNTTLAMGSRVLSSKGAIVTRLASIEAMAGMDMLCSDKTGTLTLNKMVIQDDCPTFSPNENKDSILFQAALAAKWTEPPRDALDTMVLKTGLKLPQGPDPNAKMLTEEEKKKQVVEVISEEDIRIGQKNLDELNTYTQIDFTPFDPRTKKTVGVLRGPDGKMFSIAKGAPHVILGMCHNKDEIHDAVSNKVEELGKRGIRSLAVGRTELPEEKWRMLGILTFLDPPRPDTKETIENAGKLGVEVKMITGDHKVVAVETARVLGLGTAIQGPEKLPVLGPGGLVPTNLAGDFGPLIVPACGFAQVFPEHKYLIVETLRQVGFRCGMTGDGVNDAPALKRADVGIAVQGSTDAARAAADIVLTGEGLSVCIDAIRISREIFSRLKNFLTYRIAATLQLLTFFFIAVFSLPPANYYQANGFKALDTVINNPNIGGSTQTVLLDQLWPMALPRKSPVCPNGYQGANDPNFKNYLDSISVTTTTTSTYISVLSPSTTSGSKQVSTSTSVQNYYKIDAMNPGNPLSKFYGITWSPGCNITLPICNTLTTWIGTGTPPSGVPSYVQCEGWPFYYQLPVLMIMLITLLNDGALISIGYDNVVANPEPERWNLGQLFSIAIVLGSVGCGASLLLLAAALDSNNPNGIFAGLGLPPVEYGKAVTLLYLQVSLTAFLTLFSARTQDKFFFQVLPSPILFCAATTSLIISTFLASFWPRGILDGLPVLGLALGDYTLFPLWVWIYCICWWFVQDCLKVAFFAITRHYKLFTPFVVDREPFIKALAAQQNSASMSDKPAAAGHH